MALSLSNKFRRQRGQFLMELLLAVAMMGLLMPVLISSLVIGRDSLPQQLRREQARVLLQSTNDILRTIRERGWEFVNTNGTYHPVVDGNTWLLAPNSDTQLGLTRSIFISEVYRDQVSGEIVDSGGVADPSTKRVILRISWLIPEPSQVEQTLYITRYLDNITQEDTLFTEFEAGTHTGTTAVLTNDEGDGQVILGSGGSGSWCSPIDSVINEIDLPKSGVANALTAVEGRAFVGTGENASGVSFAEVTISNPTPPALPSAMISAEVNGYKTNDVFGETVLEGETEVSYAYLATDSQSEEVVIINTGTATKVGSFNSPGSGSDIASAIFVQGNVGYVVQGSRLYTFDLTEKTGSRPILDEFGPDNAKGVGLSGTGSRIEVEGTYAYISLSSGVNELQIVNVEDPRNLPNPIGQANLGSKSARDVVINDSGSRAFVVTDFSPSEAELYAVDTSTKTGNLTILGTYNTSGSAGDMSPKGVTLVPGNRVIVVGHDGEEYQVITVSDRGTSIGMTHCGGYDLNLNINGVASVYEEDGDAYSYIITTSADKEFKILEGGPGGQFSLSGTFESQTIDAGYTTAFNYIIATKVDFPPQTILRYQVAVADAVDNSCDNAVFSYVGPLGNPGAFYTDEGAIPLNDDGVGYENPGRCFRYKAYFDTLDSSQSPILDAMQVNYSP